MSNPSTPPEPLKIGDVVRLKSGGPPMTVVKVPAAPPEPAPAGTPAGLITCFWMDDTGGAVHEHDFVEAALAAHGGHGPHKGKK